MAGEEIEVIAWTGDRCGEAVTWAAAENALYWCDINRFLLHRIGLADRRVQSWRFDAPVVALSLTQEPGRLVVATGREVRLWSVADGPAAEPLFTLEDWPRLRLNDGRSDPEGRFWIGSMRSNVGPKGEQLEAGGTDGVLYRIGSDGVVPQRSGIGVPNTLCWAPDGRSFYFADTLADVIWRHDYDAETGRIGPPEVLIEKAGPGWPDGSTIDADGCLWNCRFGGGVVLRITPQGKVDRVIEMPTGSPTTATFGGPGLGTLYVTSASVGMAADDQMAGCLFALQPGVQGLPENISLF